MLDTLDPWEIAARKFEPTPPNPYLGRPVDWARERQSLHLWSKQRDIARSVVEHKRTAVKSCHDAGKCIYDQEMILLADGRLEKAADLVGTTFAVLAFGPDGKQIPSTAWATDNGVKPVYRVRTSSGREVVRTGNHPLFMGKRTGGGSGMRSVVTSVGWTNVEDIVPGDLVLVPERLDMPQQRSPLTDDQVKFLGYLLGDGGTTHYVGFTQQPGPTMDEFCAIAEALGGRVQTSPYSKYGAIIRGAQDGRWRQGSNPVLNFVREHGLFGVKARDKHLPEVAWKLPNEHLALLLNRLFACDGYAYVRQDRGQARAQIGISLASERLIRDIELAMLRLGIVGQTRARKVKFNGNTYNAWEWALNRAQDIRRFAEVVGIFGKEEALAEAVAVAEQAGRVSRWQWREAPAGYRWERVTEIEPQGTEPTVVISVPEHHTFLTTFVEHNSFIAGTVAEHWIDVHPPGEAFIVSTAPTYRQVHAILWEEIRAGAKRAKAKGNPLPGRILQSDEWKLDDGTLVGWGRKPANQDEHGFQGIHRRFVLVILDEACGIPEQLWTAVEAITTNADCRILAIGNPDDPNTEFGKVCRPGSGWNIIQISAFDTPNFTDEPVPESLRPLLLSREWEEDKRKRWGEKSPRYVSKVLGDFPEIGDDTLISPRWIEAAQARELEPGAHNVLGVDVARFGADRTIFALARGPVVRVVGDHAKLRTTETTGLVIEAKREHAVHEVHVDGVGVGSGVVDELLEAGHDVVDMQSGAAAVDSEHFANARAEWWWGLRQRFEAGDMDLDLDDDELAAQLGTVKFKYTARGQVLIESKDDMRKRGLPSPDRADAVMLAKAHVPPPDDIVGAEDLDEELAGFEISPW